MPHTYTSLNDVVLTHFASQFVPVVASGIGLLVVLGLRWQKIKIPDEKQEGTATTADTIGSGAPEKAGM